MIKKTLPILIIGIMILSGLGAGIIPVAENTSDPNDINNTNYTNNENTNIETRTLNINVATPTFTDQDEFTTINLQQSEAFMSRTGSPMLPIITKTFSFPIGTVINDVSIDIEWQQHHLDKKVAPAPLRLASAVEVDLATLEEQKFNEDIYSSTTLYPAEPYTIRYGVGIEKMEHVIFVNVKCFPQYSPANDEINIPANIDINIEHQLPNTPKTTGESYDLIIITHDIFEDELQPLVAHKESHGITTKLVTVDEIYENYDGVADWEKIKFYLADHILDWDTKFVLLAGGHIGQTHDWYVPAFRSHNWNPISPYGDWDAAYACDLYYADIYGADNQGNIFLDTWDQNMNGIYAEGPLMPLGTDNMDYYPDVHVGRLPMRYEWEATIAVDKIINYENNADDSWFKTAVLAGGDCFPPERYGGIADPNAWEGEIVCDVVANLLSEKGVTSTKCYCSPEGDIYTKGSSDVYNEISKGCGIAHLTGHSSPFVLGSYKPGTGINPPPLVPFYTLLNAKEFDCGYKLPFMINEGCHNAQFDVTGQELIDYIFDVHPNFRFGYDEWVPHDGTSWLVLQKGGGAIAAIGNTALGSGGLNYGCTEIVGGWLCIRFFKAWAIDNEEYTGSILTNGLSAYIDTFDVILDDTDRKTLEERVLIGDPSIKLGGYGSSFSDPEDPENPETEEDYGSVSSSMPTWSVGDSWTYALDNIDIDLSLAEGRAITLKLSSADIILEVIEVTDDTYVTSLTTDNIDVTFGGMFDFRIPDKDAISIPTVSFDNIQMESQIIFDKETLGINNVDLGLIIDLAENIDNLEDIIGMEIPSIIKTFISRISIPLILDVNIEFDSPIELLQFPLTNEKAWGVPANIATITIDGSVQSVWLRVLQIVNNIVPIVPEEFAQYLPVVDISDVLNDFGIETTYEIGIEVPTELLDASVLEVLGSESISTGAGTFTATKVSIMDNNANIYYSESTGNIIKIIGYTNDYIPIIDNINIELIE